MNVYTKFLTILFLKSLIFVTIITISLVFVLNLLSELDFFKNINTETYFLLFLSVLNSPSMLFEIFPFILLITTQLFFIKLFNNNEIEVFKYSGLKNSKILGIISINALIVGLIVTTLFYNLSSNLKNFYLELKSPFTSDGKYLAVITNNGLWIKDIYNENIMIINASSFNNNELVDIYISEFDKDFEIIRNIKSKKVDITNKEWIIKDAEIYIQNNKEVVESLKFKTNFDYALIQSLFSNMSSLSFIELIEMRKNYKKLNYSLTEIDLQLFKLVSFPFYFILMFIFAAIIMMNTKTFKSKSLKIIIGLFFSVIIYYINNFFYILGNSEKINVFSSIIIPLTILTIINSIFMRNINDK